MPAPPLGPIARTELGKDPARPARHQVRGQPLFRLFGRPHRRPYKVMDAEGPREQKLHSPGGPKDVLLIARRVISGARADHITTTAQALAYSVFLAIPAVLLVVLGVFLPRRHPPGTTSETAGMARKTEYARAWAVVVMWSRELPTTDVVHYGARPSAHRGCGASAPRGPSASMTLCMDADARGSNNRQERLPSDPECHARSERCMFGARDGPPGRGGHDAVDAITRKVELDGGGGCRRLEAARSPSPPNRQWPATGARSPRTRRIEHLFRAVGRALRGSNAIDCPGPSQGWGRSDRPEKVLDVAAPSFIAAEDLGRCALVANSLGCQFVIELAKPARVEDLVAGLVFISQPL